MFGASGYDTSMLFIGIFMGLVMGWLLCGSHPYDRCIEMYQTPEDISECVWLLENKDD